MIGLGLSLGNVAVLRTITDVLEVPETRLASVDTGTAAFRATSERQVIPINDLSQLTAAGGSGGVADVPLAITFDSSPAAIECRSVDSTTGAQVNFWATLATSSSGTWGEVCS